MELRKTYRFEASHILPKHPGKCSRLHGHSWVLHVAVRGPVNRETGFVMDFGDISKVVKPIVEALDHRHLGQWDIDINSTEGVPKYNPFWAIGGVAAPIGFYPTSENLLLWLAPQLWPLDMWEIKRANQPAEYRTMSPDEVTNYQPGSGPWLRRTVEWSSIAIEETCTSYALLTRKEYDSNAQ